MDITPERIAPAYRKLADGKRLLYDGSSEVAEITNAVEDMRFIEQAQGKITGKNEGEREGNFRLAHPDLIEAQRKAEQVLKYARFMHDLAQLEVDEVGRIMRLAELTQTATWVHGEATV